MTKGVFAIVLATAFAAPPRPAQAQVVSGVLGAAGGMAAGVYVTTSVYVTKARFGRYLFSIEDALGVQPESLPLVVLPVSGLALGIASPPRLEKAALWGGAGVLAGVAVGVGAGQLIWRSNEGRWAGAIIGGATGLLVGSVLGALSHDEPGERSGPALSITLPFSLRVR